MGVKAGSILTAHLTVLGQKLMLLNGYAEMSFNESISFVVPCKTQREIDGYWKKLASGGGRPVQCGWVIDKFGARRARRHSIRKFQRSMRQFHLNSESQ